MAESESVKTYKTILLVEDEALIALAERKLLERSGYHVLTAKTGEAAVEITRTTAGIDLILMDIDLLRLHPQDLGRHGTSRLDSHGFPPRGRQP